MAVTSRGQGEGFFYNLLTKILTAIKLEGVEGKAFLALSLRKYFFCGFTT